jgi:hypothetical protein
MAPIAKLPEFEKGAPDIIKFEVQTDDTLLLGETNLFVEFQQTLPTSHNYFNLLVSIKEILIRSVFDNNYNIYVKIIDQDGNSSTPQGQEMIDRFSHKIFSDFSSIQLGIPNEIRFLTNVTWLFLKTPSNVTNRLMDILSMPYDLIPLSHWNRSVEAASRTFRTLEEFAILFTTICKRIIRPPLNAKPFPIQSDRAVWRVLAFREWGYEGLERDQAKLLIDQSVRIMREQATQGNFLRRYFQAAQLFFFLLRFRCKDPSFLNPENPHDRDIFDQAISCLKMAEAYFRWQPGAQRARNILKGIEEYMYFKGKGIVVFDGLTEGNADGAGDD